MKINEIKVKNFRQFYGEQVIQFATGEQNITIIFGENGKGKTGIFRALMFGLYGTTYIQQDNPRDPIHLVNFKAMEENLNMPVDGYVEVSFQYRGKTYIIKREIQGYKTRDEITERKGDVKLNIIDEQGNYSPESINNETDVNNKINEILDVNIKDFFLFDAEKIETLTKTDASVKAEVKTGIVKLLQIDKLENAIDLLNRLYNSERKKILANIKDVDLTRKNGELDDVKTAILNMNEKLELKEKNLSDCSKEITSIQEKLSENEEVRKIQEKLESEKEKKVLQKRLAKDKQNEIKKMLETNGYNILMKDSYVSIRQYLEQVMVDQKDLIPIEVIDKSLKDGVCACCNNDLQTHSENLRFVELLKNNYKRSELTPLVSLITNNTYDYEIEEKEVLRNIRMKLTEYRQIKDAIDDINKTIDSYKQSVSDKAQEQENLKHLEEGLKAKEAQLMSLKVEIEGLKNGIKAKEDEQSRIEKELEKMLRANQSLQVDNRVLEYISDLKSGFTKISNEYSDEMRTKITDEATNIFRSLIDRKDKELINKIDINDKYEIEIVGWENVKITQDISQGQRQVVALSFITALAKIASGGSKEIEFPLFMDTPFGRISGNNRDHLIDHIPDLTSQWILLLTDTELSKSEEIRFKSTGKLGRWYRLDQQSTGHTIINPVEINETMATRG